MKKYLISKQGFTLLELLIGITLSIILLSGMLRFFSTSINLWNIEKNRTSMQQTARLAVDRIMKDIRYAQGIQLNHPSSLKITKMNGETNTFQLGGALHENTLYMIIDKTGATPIGGISTNPLTENVVTNLLFMPYPHSANIQAITILLEVADQNTGEKQRIETAGYPWNRL